MATHVHPCQYQVKVYEGYVFTGVLFQINVKFDGVVADV